MTHNPWSATFENSGSVLLLWFSLFTYVYRLLERCTTYTWGIPNRGTCCCLIGSGPLNSWKFYPSTTRQLEYAGVWMNTIHINHSENELSWSYQPDHKSDFFLCGPYGYSHLIQSSVKLSWGVHVPGVEALKDTWLGRDVMCCDHLWPSPSGGCRQGISSMIAGGFSSYFHVRLRVDSQAPEIWLGQNKSWVNHWNDWRCFVLGHP